MCAPMEIMTKVDSIHCTNVKQIHFYILFINVSAYLMYLMNIFTISFKLTHKEGSCSHRNTPTIKSFPLGQTFLSIQISVILL